jgi:hypothetical protein
MLIKNPGKLLRPTFSNNRNPKRKKIYKNGELYTCGPLKKHTTKKVASIEQNKGTTPT